MSAFDQGPHGGLTSDFAHVAVVVDGEEVSGDGARVRVVYSALTKTHWVYVDHKEAAMRNLSTALQTWRPEAQE